jgi:hypothetical protein
MNKTVFGLVLVAAMAANAQSSTATAPAAAAQTTTATATATAPAAAKKFGAIVILNPIMNVGDLKDNGSKATVESINSIGLTYKVNDRISTAVRHNFGYDSTKINAEGATNTYTLLDPTVHLTYKSDLTIAGSEKLAFATRYYLPMSEAQRQVSYGTARLDVGPDWNLTPAWAVGFSTSTRINFGRTDSKDARGADSSLRLYTGPSVTYNVSDKFNAYYTPYLGLRSQDFQRGKATVQTGLNDNMFVQEVGVNITAGPVSINPYWTSFADMRTGEGMGSDATSTYEMILSASF